MTTKLEDRGGIVARNCGELANIDLLPVYFGGDCFYVRKLQLPEEVGGIALCDQSRENTNWVEVVGAGPMVGETSRLVDIAEEGDFLLCPDHDGGIKLSQICEWEYIIRSSVPYAIVKREDWPEACKHLGGETEMAVDG